MWCSYHQKYLLVCKPPNKPPLSPPTISNSQIFLCNYQWEIVTIVVNYEHACFGMDYSLANNSSFLGGKKTLHGDCNWFTPSGEDLGKTLTMNLNGYRNIWKVSQKNKLLLIVTSCSPLSSQVMLGYSLKQTRCKWILLFVRSLSESCVTLLGFAKYVPYSAVSGRSNKFLMSQLCHPKSKEGN